MKYLIDTHNAYLASHQGENGVDMSTLTADIFKEALDLDERDRATLAGLLIESLEEEPDGELELVWKAEVARRTAELDSGGAKALVWEDVKARLLKRSYGLQNP